MEQVVLKFLFHRKIECIGIHFSKNSFLEKIIRKQPSAKWSHTNSCWYIPLSKENYIQLMLALKGHAIIEKAGLHQYLQEKKEKETAANKTQNIREPENHVKATIAFKVTIDPAKGVAGIYKDKKIQPVNSHIVPAMLQKLKLKAYSASTIKTYVNEMSQLLQTIGEMPADELTPEHLRRYLVYCYEKLTLTANTLHSRINAMKFYYEQVLRREKFFWEIPRPRKQYILPKVLGETELKRLFNALQNKKHKAILFTAYSAGLRVSEVVNLELKHIDRSRMQILIRNAKGKKDRYVMLSPLLLDIISNYYKTSEPGR